MAEGALLLHLRKKNCKDQRSSLFCCCFGDEEEKSFIKLAKGQDGGVEEVSGHVGQRTRQGIQKTKVI